MGLGVVKHAYHIVVVRLRWGGMRVMVISGSLLILMVMVVLVGLATIILIVLLHTVIHTEQFATIYMDIIANKIRPTFFFL